MSERVKAVAQRLGGERLDLCRVVGEEESYPEGVWLSGERAEAIADALDLGGSLSDAVAAYDLPPSIEEAASEFDEAVSALGGASDVV